MIAIRCVSVTIDVSRGGPIYKSRKAGLARSMLLSTYRSRHPNRRRKSSRNGALHDGNLNAPWDDMISMKLEMFISEKSAMTLAAKELSCCRGRGPSLAQQVRSWGEHHSRRSPTSILQAITPSTIARKAVSRCLHSASSAGPDAL